MITLKLNPFILTWLLCTISCVYLFFYTHIFHSYLIFLFFCFFVFYMFLCFCLHVYCLHVFCLHVYCLLDYCLMFYVYCLDVSYAYSLHGSILTGCVFTEVRQTITEYTMYIDGSSFYGSNEEDYPDLRTFTGGENFAYLLLSFLNCRSAFCCKSEKSDERSNLTLNLISILLYNKNMGWKREGTG